jgi:serine/threonine protein kinase
MIVADEKELTDHNVDYQNITESKTISRIGPSYGVFYESTTHVFKSMVDTTSALRELFVYKIVKHSNILPALFMLSQTGKIVLILPKLSPVNIRMRLSVKQLRGVASALALMHSVGITHNDIKPSNLVIDLQTGVVYLIDFGLSTLCFEKNLGPSGSGYFAAPESTAKNCLQNRTYSADVYSFSVMCSEFLTGIQFCKREPNDVINMLKFLAHNNPDSEFIELVIRGLDINPTSRPSMCDFANTEHLPAIELVSQQWEVDNFPYIGHIAKLCSTNRAIGNLIAYSLVNTVSGCYFDEFLTKVCRGCVDDEKLKKVNTMLLSVFDAIDLEGLLCSIYR